jgi:hypothetical protein
MNRLIRHLAGGLLLSVALAFVSIQTNVEFLGGGIDVSISSDAHALLVKKQLAENPDGTRDTAFPTGNKPIGGSVCSTWTCDDFGAAVADIDEDSATQVTLAVDSPTDEGEIGLAYKSFASGDINARALLPAIASWDGYTGHNFTGVGVGIRETTEVNPEDDYFAQCWLPKTGGLRCKYGTPGNTSNFTGELSEVGPIHTVAQYDESATDLKFGYSSDGNTFTQLGETVDKTLTCTVSDPCLGYAFVTSHATGQTTILSVTEFTANSTLTNIGAPPTDPGPRQVFASINFESGQLQANGTDPDGVFLATLPEPQTDTNACPHIGTFSSGGDTLVKQCSIGSGGAGPLTSIDARVAASDTVPASGNGGGAEVVNPRAGDFFFRNAIYFGKDYSQFTGNSLKNKPRVTMVQNNTYRTTFDKEGYTSISVYLPENFEHETGKKGDVGRNNILNMSNAQAFFAIQYFVPTAGTVAHWHLQRNDSDSTTDWNDTPNIYTDIGSVVPDLGKWTDFIIRWLWNPARSGQGYACPRNFTSAPAVSGAINASYDCDVGILQVWKSTGDPDVNGDRQMELVHSQLNTMVGLVPLASQPLIAHSIRQYKFGWHSQPTDVAGPIWHGYDEIYWGEVVRDGTTWQDVHPTQKACADIAVEPLDCP